MRFQIPVLHRTASSSDGREYQQQHSGGEIEDTDRIGSSSSSKQNGEPKRQAIAVNGMCDNAPQNQADKCGTRDNMSP